MKVFSELTPLKSEDLFVVIDSFNNGFDYPLHFHRECELNVVLGTSGNRMVGDSFEKYTHTDLVLVGPYLMHKWDDSDQWKDPDQDTRVITIQFDLSTFDKQLLQKKPFEQIHQLLKRAHRGIVFKGRSRNQAIKILEKLNSKSAFESMLDFFKVLQILANSKSYRYLTSVGFEPMIEPSINDRFRKAHQYILQHFRESDLRMSHVAEYVSMSTSAFSHFFRKYTNRSFTNFLITMRLGYACKLLLDSDILITDLVFSSGFNNQANFNRQFKKQYGHAPRKFRQLYQKSTSVEHSFLSNFY